MTKRMNPTDSDLVSAYINGRDQQAFGMLLARHQERIFGYLVGMVRDRTVADDLFQETFIRAIRAMNAEKGSYDAQGKWVQWIMRIARNTALDHMRTQKRRRSRAVFEDDEKLDMDQIAVDGEPTAFEALQREEQNEFLYACIDRLPDEQREVVLLRHESDLTFREIAELTDCSINTALGRMRYALQNLRRMMEETNVSELKRIELASS
ncbi:MAG: RNA polymerase sigma factor [Rhodothermia bacterium]